MAKRLMAAATLLLLLGTSLPSAGAAPGVNRTRIKIGLHASLTGAAPVPSSSIEKGKDLFFRWMKSQGQSIHGRDVEVVLKNDQFNPSTAVQVCKDMVENDHVFMIFGIGHGDQTVACARYAASVGVPYVSPGTQASVLRPLENYFATSMTWPAQGRLLGSYLLNELGGTAEKNGALAFDTPAWISPLAAFRNRLEKGDSNLHYQRRVSKGAGASEARTVVQEMRTNNIENVFVQISPIWFLQVMSQAETQSFNPQWIGIDSGIAKEAMLDVACRNHDILEGARFFSPYPALADTDRFDPDFRDAVDRFYSGDSPDDYMWQLWAMEKALAKMLRVAGSELTRDHFINRVGRATIKTGIMPVLRYRPNDHFGAKAMHVLRASCGDSRWHTGATFRSGF
jgi:branched-chain amino acid transport system substrate-binding protein